MNAPHPPFFRSEDSVNERDDDVMRRFLAADLSDSERAAVEERFMRDADFYESLTSLEHEMMVDLIKGRLSPHWAGLFEAAIAAAPDRRRRLENVRALIGAMPASGADAWPASRASGLRWLALAASLVLVAASAALWLQRAPATAPVPGDPAASPEPPPIVLTAFLRPGPARSAADAINQLTVAADASRLRLVSVLDERVPGPVEARMRAVGGAGLELPSATRSRVTDEGLEVVWELPAAAVDAGDYLITYNRADAGSERVLATRFVRITK